VNASAPGTAGRVRVRDDLAGMVPYGAPQLDVPVRLNTNETPHAVPPEVLDDLAETVRGLELHRYPDREATELREALALHAGHGFEGTWAANGSNEVLQQLLLAFAGPGRTALVVEPTYAMHSLLARATGTRLVTRVQPRDRLLDPAAAADLVAEAAADLTFWCSPNNPTGEATGPEVLAAVCAAAPALVVVDEAYGEFGTSHAADLLSRHPNLVVTRTFSKAFRMAGLRLGYLLADPAADQGLPQRRLDRDVQVVKGGLDRADDQEPLGVVVGELDCHLVSEFDDARVLRWQLVGGDGPLQDPGQEGQLVHVMPVLRAGPPVLVRVIEVAVGEPGNRSGGQPGGPHC